MNSLNIISARVIGTPNQTPTQSRSTSYRDLTKANVRAIDSIQDSVETDGAFDSTTYSEKPVSPEATIAEEEEDSDNDHSNRHDEKTPLLGKKGERRRSEGRQSKKWNALPRHVLDTFVESLRWLLSTIGAPGVYIISCFYDDRGKFAPLQPFRRIGRASSGKKLGGTSSIHGQVEGSIQTHDESVRKSHGISSRRSPSVDSNSSAMSTDSELDQGHESVSGREERPSSTRSISDTSPDDAPPTRRSIRIKLYNEDGQKSRKGRKAKTSPGDSNPLSEGNQNTITPATLKSPTSSASSLRMTKYPRAPAPPRPLIPKRQPSYAFPNPSAPRLAQKTLILDLDETLIHSLSKGGRMSTGHMVEVKLNTPVGLGGGVAIGPQHPILYYVHKRPHCDEFLRKISQWYNLVVFTASVQEYADPVIDWLEQDRKYFSGRYYRQHCTFRQGNYIKDLSAVEPDLSKVMIVDNSPTSYVFHEDNAIPIEGWINDPTDNDLLHLIPLLEAMQYVTDVRALLALRMGEASAP